jgi:hypothetical protein
MDGGSRLLSRHALPSTALLGTAGLLWLALVLLAVAAAALGLDLGPTPDSHLLLSPTRWPAPNAALV